MGNVTSICYVKYVNVNFLNQSQVTTQVDQVTTSWPRWSRGNVLEIQGSWIQIRLRSMDFFQDVKILSTNPAGGPKSEISGSLKNLKPEKIGL